MLFLEINIQKPKNKHSELYGIKNQTDSGRKDKQCLINRQRDMEMFRIKFRKMMYTAS